MFRRTFSASVKREALDRSKVDGVPRCECYRVPGFAHMCGRLPLVTGDIIYDHVDPWEVSRNSSLGNCAVLTRRCSDLKTGRRDIPAIAKVKRISGRHFGTSNPPRRPMAGGRKSKLKITIDRRIVPRVSQVDRMRGYLATLPERRR